MIGFIGGGNMAEAIISGLLRKGIKNIIVSDVKKERLKYLQKSYGIKTTSDNLKLLSLAEVIILAVKPQQMEDVLTVIKESIKPKHLIISIAAGIRLSFLMDSLSTDRVVRVMPNTPALIGEGISVLTFGKGVGKRDRKRAEDIFSATGRVLVMDEAKMDVVTALSGSGPAFFAYFIESMAEAGLRMGLGYSEALELTLQTALGTVKMIDKGISTDELKRMVTSPGGTTAEGLFVFDHGSVKAVIKEAIEAATLKAEELSRR